MIYNVTISEHRRTDLRQHQSFDAVCDETGDRIVASLDPEHEMARILARGSPSDRQMQTWSETTPSMLFASVRRTATYSVRFRDQGPIRLEKFRSRPRGEGRIIRRKAA